MTDQKPLEQIPTNLVHVHEHRFEDGVRRVSHSHPMPDDGLDDYASYPHTHRNGRHSHPHTHWIWATPEEMKQRRWPDAKG